MERSYAVEVYRLFLKGYFVLVLILHQGLNLVVSMISIHTCPKKRFWKYVNLQRFAKNSLKESFLDGNLSSMSANTIYIYV